MCVMIHFLDYTIKNFSPAKVDKVDVYRRIGVWYISGRFLAVTNGQIKTVSMHIVLTN